MKLNKHLLIIGSLLSCHCSYAQVISLGLKTGLNLSTTSSSSVPLYNEYAVPDNTQTPRYETSELKLLPGLAAGIVGQYEFNSLLYVKSELLYSQQGELTKSTTGGGAYSFFGNIYRMKHRTSYLQLPVLTGFQTSMGRTKLYFEAGPYVGLLVYEQWKNMEGYKKDVQHLNTPDAYSKIDAGAAGGFGITFFRNKCAAELRFSAGFVDKYKNHFYYAVKNQNTSVSVRYNILSWKMKKNAAVNNESI